MYFVIMAGGKGTRFWPKSTRKKPKQFLNLLGDRGDRTLLQQTVDRILPISKPDEVYIVTDAALEEEVRHQLPHIPADNVITEPMARGTLPGIGLAALYIRIRRKDKDSKDSKDSLAILASLPADHLILDEEKFRQSLLFAYEMAQRREVLITFGIKPTRPETGYGYISSDRLLDSDCQFQAFNIAEFVEKPNKGTAMKFLESGKYLWNSGIFVWRISTFMEAVKIQAPDIYELLCQLDSTAMTKENLKKVYPLMRNVSIDYGIMEKASNRAVIGVDIGWDDLGNWTSMEKIWKNGSDLNACIGRHIGLDTQDCIIYSPDKLVATIGLKGLVVVEVEKVLLICPKDRAQDVKALVEKLSKEGLKGYL